MDGIGNFISMMDYILDTKEKTYHRRHSVECLFTFGGLALTVMTIQNEEDEDE